MDEAVKKLNEKIKEIDKKSRSIRERQSTPRGKHWNSALKELEVVGKKQARYQIKEARSEADGPLQAKVGKGCQPWRVVTWSRDRIDDVNKISPEAKAEIKEKGIGEDQGACTEELQSKQKELREARSKLSQLRGKLRAAAAVARVNSIGTETVKDLAVAKVDRLGVVNQPSIPSNGEST